MYSQISCLVSSKYSAAPSSRVSWNATSASHLTKALSVHVHKTIDHLLGCIELVRECMRAVVVGQLDEAILKLVCTLTFQYCRIIFM